MANKEHLTILRQGVEAWNKWRIESPDVIPDLIWEDLRGANLSGANLIEAKLHKTNLSGANLNLAYLSGADLREAVLIKANLNGAYSSGVNLSGANLSGADLSEANLNGANLIAANLIEAKLRKATLGGANLNGANLSGADLSWTKLIRANLRGADLRETNLNGADLSGSDLTQVDLAQADLSEAYLSGTTLRVATLRGAVVDDVRLQSTAFCDVDLSNTQGLENVIHQGPSYIDIHTIYRSKGEIPEAFLRGCGVPDVFIEYMGSLVGRAIEYYSCFISYSHQDQALAQRLHADLQNNGVRCWYAPHDLRPGDRYAPRIDEAIRLHDKLLLILSENSVTSDWVQREVESALNKERQTDQLSLFPIRIDNTVLRRDTGWASHIRKARHIGDFQNWKDHNTYQQVFHRLLNALKTDQNAPPVTPVFTAPDQQTTDLANFIQSHFNRSELEDLYHFVDAPYDDVPGQSVPEKARELVAYFNRHRPGGAATLTDYLKAKRPNLVT